MTRFDAILFDLDNTLLRIESESDFFEHYLQLVAREFKHLVPPQRLVAQLMASTQVLVENVDPSARNIDVFMADFCAALELDRDTASAILIRFYRESFPKLRLHCRPTPSARQVVDSARDAGLQVVVATNPLFPADAIFQRLGWAGFEPAEFSLVTTIEDMHACKPQPEYYREITDRIGVRPDNCLMIGNDPVDDVAARCTGMTVYLVNHGCWREPGELEPHYRGDLAGAMDLWTDNVTARRSHRV